PPRRLLASYWPSFAPSSPQPSSHPRRRVQRTRASRELRPSARGQSWGNREGVLELRTLGLGLAGHGSPPPRLGCGGGWNFSGAGGSAARRFLGRDVAQVGPVL